VVDFPKSGHNNIVMNDDNFKGAIAITNMRVKELQDVEGGFNG